VLDCFGNQLRKLHLERILDLDPVDELLTRNQIEFLTFHQCKFIAITNASALIDRIPRVVLTNRTNLFLPELKELKAIATCLGYWSFLFECQRPSLTKLKVNCSHIGLASTCQFNDGHLSNLWPNLKKFQVYNAYDFDPKKRSVVCNIDCEPSYLVKTFHRIFNK
jgi:hypothetical protein